MMKRLAVIAFVAACSGSSKPPPTEPTGSGSGSTTTADANCTDPKPAADSVCLQDCGPPVAREGDPTPPWRWVTPADAANRQQFGCPRCLPPDVAIATPAGDVAISTLRAGSIVWSMNEAGERVAVPVVHVGSSVAPRTHHVVAIALADGRTVTGSPGHPTADARTLGALRIGDSLDGSTIVTITPRPYAEQRTYDLLPASASRAYWANGVLLASTFKAAAR